MAEPSNVTTVEQIYAAYGRGDIPAIMGMARHDVEWVVPGPVEIPWYGVRRGKEALSEFFASMSRHTVIRAFETREFLARDDKVVVLTHIEYEVQHNAGVVSQDHAHVWTIKDGKIARFQDYQETAGVVAAWRGI